MSIATMARWTRTFKEFVIFLPRIEAVKGRKGKNAMPRKDTSGGTSGSQNAIQIGSRLELFVDHHVIDRMDGGVLRTVSRATSEDFAHWQDKSATFKCPNLPGEELYTNQTHPYFRAPHIYVATPTRFAHSMLKGKPVEGDRWGAGNLGSTDIMFMTARAGANAYQRTFKEAWIRPGLDPARWENRANYMALNIVPTGPAEMSLYHRSGARYVLRTDGFASVNAPWDGGRLTTKPIVFDGSHLVLNASTSIRGEVRVELQDAGGRPLPGFALSECLPITGDSIESVVAWRGKDNVHEHVGKPVRITFELKDSDIYSFRFCRERKHFANPTGSGDAEQRA